MGLISASRPRWTLSAVLYIPVIYYHYRIYETILDIHFIGPRIDFDVRSFVHELRILYIETGPCQIYVICLKIMACVFVEDSRLLKAAPD